MNQPYISVVIPTLGRVNVLEECLNALLAQTFNDFEVVIVTDNKEKIEFIKTKYSQLKIITVNQGEKGLTPARNAGLNNSSGKIISFIDDDAIVSLFWAQEVYNTFNSSLDIGGVSGPTIIAAEILNNRDILAFHSGINKDIFWRLIGRIYNYFVLEDNPFAVGKIFRSGGFSFGSNYPESAKLPGNIDVDYLEACNMSFLKAALDKTGGFSSEYKGVGDWSEPDLSFRVKRAGFRLVFSPKASVNHNVSRQGVFAARGKDSYYRIVNFFKFYLKWIKLDSLDKGVRFGVNLIFLNLYWCYKFAQTGSIYWLRGLLGTIRGLYLILGL